jgi:uncharacterized membrane protein YkgB
LNRLNFVRRRTDKILEKTNNSDEDQARRNEMNIGTILVIVLVLALLGVIPTWGYSRNWGYGPSGGIGVVVLIIVILLLLGYI